VKGKYIIYEGGSLGGEEVILFGTSVQHLDFRDLNPIRAGFFAVYRDNQGNEIVAAYGKSATLGVESNPKLDSRLIRIAFRMND